MGGAECAKALWPEGVCLIQGTKEAGGDPSEELDSILRAMERHKCVYAIKAD